MRNEYEMSRRTLKKLTNAARPDCADCNGTGLVPVCYGNDPDKCADELCKCVDGDFLEEMEGF